MGFCTPLPSPTSVSRSMSHHFLENMQDDNTFNASPELPWRTLLYFLKNRSGSFEQVTDLVEEEMEHRVLKYKASRMSYQTHFEKNVAYPK